MIRRSFMDEVEMPLILSNSSVAKYPFADHNAPPFLLMKPFCEDVANYLAEDSKYTMLSLSPLNAGTLSSSIARRARGALEL